MAGILKSAANAIRSGIVRPAGLVRGLRTSARRMEDDIRADCLGQMHKPTNFQKKTLVWSRVYKTIEEIPDRVTTSKLKRAQDICRIYGTSLMIIFGAIGSVVVIAYSRHMRNTGQDGITLRYQLQMAKWKADAEKEQRQKAESAAKASAQK